MKATKFLILFCATVLISSGCSNSKQLASQFGGVENVTIITKPDSVNAWRTIGSLNPRESRNKDFYKKTGVANLVTTDLAAQLSKILLDKHSYLQLGGTLKLCLPEPGVVITFSNGKKDVDVFFCFECNILIAPGGSTDFDPCRPQLVRIMKQIFPKDPQIQSLNE
jgi:hypothetical protein